MAVLRAQGYPLETVWVTTPDGYKLALHRIPHGRGGKGGGPPVLLIHGVSLSSTCWVVNQPDESLAFILADKGYDVVSEAGRVRRGPQHALSPIGHLRMRERTKNLEHSSDPGSD